MKWCIMFLVLAPIVSGCASLPIDKLKPGMTQAQVEELFGEKPISYMKYGTVEVIDYARDYICTLYFLDGKLREWRCVEPGGTGSFVGVTIPMPAPPVRY